METTSPEPKLVRDRIPEIIEASGRIPDIEVLGTELYLTALHAKLDEELAEVRAALSSEEIAEEIADVLEVLRALAEASGVRWLDVEEVRVKKLEQRGGFTRRFLLRKS